MVHTVAICTLSPTKHDAGQDDHRRSKNRVLESLTENIEGIASANVQGYGVIFINGESEISIAPHESTIAIPVPFIPPSSAMCRKKTPLARIIVATYSS